MFVVKFRGAGQGAKALIAELVVGALATALDLPAPELALIDVPEPFGRSEPDPEIRDLLRASHGINVGLRYLDGAFNFAPSAAAEMIGAPLASRIVWLDAFTTNPDRTHRNPNLLIWQRRPWLIDHGAALYAHHDWANVDAARVRTPFPLIKEHVLLGCCGDIQAADARLAPLVTLALIEDVLANIPDTLLVEPAIERDLYRDYLNTRIAEPRDFVGEAVRA